MKIERRFFTVFFLALSFFSSNIFTNDTLAEHLNTITCDATNENDAAKFYFEKFREMILTNAESNKQVWVEYEPMCRPFLAQDSADIINDHESRSLAQEVISAIIDSQEYCNWKKDPENDELKWLIDEYMEEEFDKALTRIADKHVDAAKDFQIRIGEKLKRLGNFQIWCFSLAKIQFPRDLQFVTGIHLTFIGRILFPF